MQADKERLSIVCLGEVDTGKSTTIGHLLYGNGVNKNEIKKKVEDERKLFRDHPFKYSLLLNSKKSENLNDATMKCSYSNIETNNKIIQLIDTPGNRYFMKNMLTGASQGDFAMLVVTAYPEEFEKHIDKTGYLRELCIVLYAIGIRQVVVVINKMDEVKYSKDRFINITINLSEIIRKTGIKLENVSIVPISALYGDNMFVKSDNMRWYGGLSLIETLNSLNDNPKRYLDKPLRIPIRDVFYITGVGVVLIGKVASGSIQEGQKLQIAPLGKNVNCPSLESNHTRITKASSGDTVSLCIPNTLNSIKTKSNYSRGMVIGDESLCRQIISFEVKFVFLGRPRGPLIIKRGYEPIISVHTSHVPCKIISLIKKIDRMNGTVLENNPEILGQGDCCICEFKPSGPIILETFKDNPSLGRLIARDNNLIIGIGSVTEIKYREIKPYIKK